jgi:sigma-B regulation protein RsbU (phosphoserine phosphatase)
MTDVRTDAPPKGALPEAVRQILDEFRERLGVHVCVWAREAGERGAYLYPEGGEAYPAGSGPPVITRVTPREGPELELELVADGEHADALAGVICATIERMFDFGQEIRFFTYELSERYEEINLLYSISETLGSILRLDDAARAILTEVCDVLGARRGSLWVYDPEANVLRLTASEGAAGPAGPLRIDDPRALTAQVFREGRAMIAARDSASDREAIRGSDMRDADSFLSVPIRYTPPAGESRTVGVINLIGRRHGGRFTASDQKLLSAIASQVGAALENNRLIQESLAQERVAREMELAHNLQMKLLPVVEQFEGADVAGRVKPADSVGGDFYNLFRLPGGRIGVMIGDVSSHGFPAALIMALSMSAATIYASEFGDPSKVLRHIDDALRGELESTEMYLTLFYGVIDPERGLLNYSNAGHPHAFVVHADGTRTRLGATDPPVGIAGPASYAEVEETWSTKDDLLVLFTDGLSDVLSPDGTGEKGEEIVLDEVMAHWDAPTPEIIEALFSLTAAHDASIPPDDRTALVLRV